MKKEVQIVMLPTDEASKIFKEEGILKFNPANIEVGGNFSEYQHLYFLSDEIPVKGDWFYNYSQNIVAKVDFDDFCPHPKIIATTDKSLETSDEIFHNTFKQVLARPSNEFIKLYCELGGIDKCLVEYVDNGEEGWSGSNEDGEPIWVENWQLKVAPDNTINCYIEIEL